MLIPGPVLSGTKELQELSVVNVVADLIRSDCETGAFRCYVFASLLLCEANINENGCGG